MISSLRLREAVLLLAVRDLKGGFRNSAALASVLASAILMELVQVGRIRIEKVKRSTVVRLVDQRLVGDPVLDQWLNEMRLAQKELPVSHWQTRIGQTRKLVDRIAERLWHAGLLRRDHRSFLMFDYHVYVLGYPEPKKNLVDHVRRLVLEDGKVDAGDAALIALLSKSGLLSPYLTRQERRRGRGRIRTMVDSQPFGADGAAALVAIQAITATVFAILFVLNSAAPFQRGN
jgi:hypothetical protein